MIYKCSVHFYKRIQRIFITLNVNFFFGEQSYAFISKTFLKEYSFEKKMNGYIYQINVKPKTGNERGIPKLSVRSAYVAFQGLEGDYNKYRMEKLINAGNPNKAVMLLPKETIDALVQEDWPVLPGHLGENITTEGMTSFIVGRQYQLGEAQIEISELCNPCINLQVLPYIGKEKIKSFMQTLLGRRGWYARVIKEGTIEQGNAISFLL